jgi:hypothetical protein
MVERTERTKLIEEMLEKLEDQDICVMVPIQSNDSSAVPVLLKADGKIKFLDASQEHEPDQETIDMVIKMGIPSWKKFRKRVLFTTRCTQETSKAPLFPTQKSTAMPPRTASYWVQVIERDYLEQFTAWDITESTTNCNPKEAKSTRYVWRRSKDDENPEESFADPLNQSHEADNAQRPKDHSFFRFPLEDGNVFQLVPESDAELVPPQDVRHFLGLKDRNLDVAEQVTSAIGILDSTGPEQDYMQLDQSAGLDNLARDLEVIGGGSETSKQDNGDHNEEDQEMEDVSNNPVGVTYTESCITGISWDYSALFP